MTTGAVIPTKTYLFNPALTELVTLEEMKKKCNVDLTGFKRNGEKSTYWRRI